MADHDTSDTFLGQPMDPSLRDQIFRRIQTDGLTRAGIFSYHVRFANGHEQNLSSKIAPVTEGEIIPQDGQSIKELPPISGRIAFIEAQGQALHRERVLDEARAQANLAGNFHAVHKLEIGDIVAPPEVDTADDRYIPFTATPIFILR